MLIHTGARTSTRRLADESKDQPALDCFMGHTTGSMAEGYHECNGDYRLLAVVNIVRAWLKSDADTKAAALPRKATPA